MADTARIREISERNARVLSLRPDKGHLTGATRARIEDGLRCIVEDGPWRLATDMPRKAGGDETAPTPGVLGRGALASCLAIGISMWAARLEIPIDAIEVEVLADFDARGELGVGGARAGYEDIRHQVHVDSPASKEEVLELIEIAERHSPYLDVFSRAQPMRRILTLNGMEV